MPLSSVFGEATGAEYGVGETQRDDRVEAQLVAASQSIAPGESVLLGVRLLHDPHWHTYWINAGDSGLASSLDWDLPEGVTAGEIQWPAPEALPFADLINYGFEGEIYLLVELSVAEDFNGAGEIPLRVRADWLMCDDVCIPGSVELASVLRVGEPGERRETAFTEALAGAQKRLPRAHDAVVSEAFRSGNRYTLDITFNDESLTLPDTLTYFSIDERTEPSAAQRVRPFPGGVRLELTRSTYASADDGTFSGVLVAGEGETFKEEDPDFVALVVSAELSSGSAPTIAGLEAARGEAGSGEPFSFFSVRGLSLVGLAFLGGLILNLMPCVFPVIGLKIMGFVSQAGEDSRRVAFHGVVFTVGVLVSFWLLAGVLIGLRGAGEELGWGFQLQSPGFVYALTVLLLAFGLNLSGVFEIGTSAVGVGSKLTAKKGFSGSFYSGVLATIVATPCAAPFLAPALGGALALPAVSSLIVFTFIGLGLAAPYLVLSIFPQLVTRLPRPGAWMETFKQFMAFLLYGTVAYLLWVLMGQLSAAVQLSALFGLVLVGLACWVFGRWGGYGGKRKTVLWARGGAVVLIVAAMFLGLRREATDVVWEPWSEERVAALRDEGRTIYVDFTARWCATCQVNKRVVFGSDTIVRHFQDNDVVALIADWTNQDPAITRALAKFDRTAVPFNLIYFPDQEDPIILPELLTPGIVLNAMQAR